MKRCGLSARTMSTPVMCDGGGVSGVRIPTSKEFPGCFSFLLASLGGLPGPTSSCHLPLLQSCLKSPPGPQLTLSLRLGRIQVRSTEVKVLKKSQIENIAALLASESQVPTAPLEELTYRRSLRVALDVLGETSSLNQESHSRKDELSLSQRENQCTEAASSGSGSPSPSLPCEDVSADCGPERNKGYKPQSLSQSSPSEKDPQCKVGPKQGLGKSETPRAQSAASTGEGSQDESGLRIRHRNRTLARKSSWCQTVPILSRREIKAENKRQALPSQAKESDPCANSKGHDPSDSLPVLPTLEQSRGRSAKRLRLDKGQRPHATHLQTESKGVALKGTTLFPKPETSECKTLHSTADKPSPAPSNTQAEQLGSPPRDHDRDGDRIEDPQSSEESMEFNSTNSILEEDEEDEEPPRILLYHEPRSFEVGMLVWLKYQKYPFWPAVVKSVRRRDKKASVLFIEGNMNPKGRGITVSLRRLKHFDCKEKQTLLDKAKEDYDQAIGWCVSLITDYRVRLGCGSFAGSFLEYYAANISYPVRKSIQQDVLGASFPQLSKRDLEEQEVGSPTGRRQPCRKVLPDRSRAARDRANQKLVEYIVKAKGAESHLRAILKSRKPSRWLKTFLTSSQYVTCVETYLEDEEQLDRVVKYLQGVYQEMDSEMLTRINGDRIRFILDVLLPEAIICAIAAVDAVDYKTAEEKYIKGPLLGYREKEIFDNQLLEERNRRRW
ncbi:PWWP domain-containing DNA repair factor 3A isoform X2 [Perognathus longimembris pacificus]|uniref:PWWP domain-containing DNA repair factor 3A isoform X2 n=1 Tax=Perognathus longimembris pacificus TaxID=214514 RepID=UPI00201A07C9|nr:PWWP domain-containing DNA repair factor 3A isoform X2 [Perognathus longimembris pacificus]